MYDVWDTKGFQQTGWAACVWPQLQKHGVTKKIKSAGAARHTVCRRWNSATFVEREMPRKERSARNLFTRGKYVKDVDERGVQEEQRKGFGRQVHVKVSTAAVEFVFYFPSYK